MHGREAEKWVETKHGRRLSWVKRRSLGSILEVMRGSALEGSEQEHGATSFVGKNDLPGVFPGPSLEGRVERDWKASRRRAGCSEGSGERPWQGAGSLAGP